MIYLNNSAASFPKPQKVLEAVASSMRNIPADSGRGGDLNIENPNFNLSDNLRCSLAAFFSIDDKNQIVFTSGATESLNLAIRGLDLQDCEVVISPVEHNSVLRPLRHLERAGKISLKIAERNIDGEITPESFEKLMSKRTGLVVVSHVSNVTGEILPCGKISEIAHSFGARFLVDASQSAGNIPVNIQDLGADLLAFTAQKSLLGIAGFGGLYVDKNINLIPLKTGGTGIFSKSQYQPESMPLCCEAGTQNECGMAALAAGIEYLNEITIEKIGIEKCRLWKRLYNNLKNIPHLQIFAPPNDSENSFTNFAFRFIGDDAPSPDEIAYRLAAVNEICVRAGLHCSPLAAESLEIPDSGTVRISPGIFNTESDIDRTVEAIIETGKEIQ